MKTTIVLVVLRARVSKVTLAYTNHRKTSAVKNSGWKSTLTETDHCTMRKIYLKSHKTTEAKVTVH
jgi:hypothetical protein